MPGPCAKCPEDGSKLLVSNLMKYEYRLLDSNGKTHFSVQAVSADLDAQGAFIVYVSAESQSPKLVRLNTRSGEKRELFRNVLASQNVQVKISNLSISGDGTKICFMSDLDTGRNRDRSFELFYRFTLTSKPKSFGSSLLPRRRPSIRQPSADKEIV